MSLSSRRKGVVGGESGQKKFLRETLALVGVHNGDLVEMRGRLCKTADGGVGGGV
ncbi:hypothetical protein [Clostridium transplantifaecale]|uniref:hypothetical protein n=1 Tax=Clostridium transplantifaecale TaxID=2479838 RepID=UPI0013DD8B87|nr:hypothetical protein [Clostridium transplantifaecale]